MDRPEGIFGIVKWPRVRLSSLEAGLSPEIASNILYYRSRGGGRGKRGGADDDFVVNTASIALCNYRNTEFTGLRVAQNWRLSVSAEGLVLD